MKGHTGKILKLDLTARKAEIIPTKKYEQWIGGLGMGTALFWDEVDKDYITDTSRISGFEPKNVLCIMPGILSGTIVPGNGRVDVCGIAPEGYPRPQFLHSNFGGHFGPMVKFAGYDGIVVTGKADKPVWVDIRDENVQIKDARHLWGLGFFDTEKQIWKEIAGKRRYGGWLDGTTQRSTILGIGPSGENLGRIACLVHGLDDGAGLGGFGGVFGSKNLKAISVIGTGSVEVARPKELLDVWQWAMKLKAGKPNRPRKGPALGATGEPKPSRSVSCFACTTLACQSKSVSSETGTVGTIGQCVERLFYVAEDTARHGKATGAEAAATQLVQDYTINACEAWDMLTWLETLYNRGLLGRGKHIDTDLDFTKLGTEEFVRDYLRKLAFREGIGNILAEGWARAAEKFGVLEEDLKSGELSAIHWGVGHQHWTNNIVWAYLSNFMARDCNAHDVTYGPTLDQTAERYAELAPPWHDPLMLDQSQTGVYSIHTARLVAWDSRFTSMKGSFPYCDFFHPDVFNEQTKDGKGISPEMEERFYAAVTGEALSWEKILEIGRKMWNLNRAILVLHGRHRNEEYFPPFPPYTSYVYEHEEGRPTLQSGSFGTRRDVDRAARKSFEFRTLPVMEYGTYKDGKWSYSTEPFPLEKAKHDEFKTLYYNLEGWDTQTGWPTRTTLVGCGLKQVADTLEKQGKHLKP
ncbi:MAG: aldehyde ferredoxin oxidoreductase N-terminal domain-containing protein [Dehalococcoidales bacterium]|nr:aldehyde ferredoxin oxidoreductase N-terminal domain-containing protein [Dehalococcoidales bacterium]